VKTRAAHRRIKLSDVIYQLWFAQVENLFVGYHERDVFTELDQAIYRTNGAFDQFTQDNATNIWRLIKLIESIKEEKKRFGKETCGIAS